MRTTSTERFKQYKVRKLTSGFIRFQPRITKHSHSHLIDLCSNYHLSQAAMITKIITETVSTKPHLDYHYSQGFIRLDLWINPHIKSDIKTYSYARSGDCLAAWILAYS